VVRAHVVEGRRGGRLDVRRPGQPVQERHRGLAGDRSVWSEGGVGVPADDAGVRRPLDVGEERVGVVDVPEGPAVGDEQLL
jgi:hypothetical protein